MPTNNEKYIKENTCTSHKRYESMVMYALHYALSDVLLESQYPVQGPEGEQYYVDGYFPELKIAIEVDEEHHLVNKETDERRQKFIEDELKCDFFRIDVSVGSIYEQVAHIVSTVKDRRKELDIAPWNHQFPEPYTGEFTNDKKNALKENNVYEYVNEFRERCRNNGLVVEDCNIPGHIPEGNGYLGFLVNLAELQFSVSVTKTKKPKLLVTKRVTKRDDALINLLDLNLSEPKKNGEYYVINEFEGRYTDNDVLAYLLLLKSKIDHRK